MQTIESLKLNLGSRTRGIPGFKNMDIDNHPGVDFVGDVSDLSRFKDCEVSEIYASHILEHFPHTKTISVLQEWLRVLRPNGKLYVAVPDFKRSVELYEKLHLSEWIVRFLMGDQEYKTAIHYNLFDEDRLIFLLGKAGFVDSYRVDEFQMAQIGECSNLISTFDGLSVSLNMIALKA